MGWNPCVKVMIECSEVVFDEDDCEELLLRYFFGVVPLRILKGGCVRHRCSNSTREVLRATMVVNVNGVEMLAPACARALGQRARFLQEHA